MAYYLTDGNATFMKYESGTYATPTGTYQWLGMVQSHDPSEDMGKMPLRYVGNTTRNVGRWENGPITINGNFSYYPQNWKMLRFVLGSAVDAGSPSPYTHDIYEANGGFSDPVIGTNFPSFTVGDGWETVTGSNFIRVVKGAEVDRFTLSASTGEPLKVDVDYVAKEAQFESGTMPSGTADTSSPYLWQDISVDLPSGTGFAYMKTFSMSVSNNLLGPHYITGSRTIGEPIPQNRDYELSATMDATDKWAKDLYDKYLIGGSAFNMVVDVTKASGSDAMVWTLSGCYLTEMSAPTEAEGINEWTITIKPTESNAKVWDSTELYTPNA